MLSKSTVMPAFNQYANNIDLHMEYKSVEIWKLFQGELANIYVTSEENQKNSAQPT